MGTTDHLPEKGKDITNEGSKKSPTRLFQSGSTGRRGFLAVVGTAAAAGFLSTGTAGQSAGTLENDEVTLMLSMGSGVGSFTLRATELDDGYLLYPSASTTYLTVQVDGTNYTTSSAGEQMDQYLTDEPAVDGESVAMAWQLPEGVVVTQTIELVGPLAEFTVDVENTSGQAHDVNVRYLFDYQVQQQDGSPIWLQNEVLTTEREFEDLTFDSWNTYNQIPDPTLTGLAEIETEPQLIQFVSWPSAVGVAYDYEIDPDRQFFDPEYESGDSAGLLYWELGSIAAGGTRSVVTRYGLGEPGEAAETFNLRFEDQESEGDSVVVQSVYLPQAGFVVIHGEDGDVLGVSEYLTAGPHEDLEISLDPALETDATLVAMLHEETNDNEAFDFVETDGAEDGPITDGEGNAVTDDALITLPGDEPEEPEEETEEEEEEEEPEAEEEEEPEEESTEEEDESSDDYSRTYEAHLSGEDHGIETDAGGRVTFTVDSHDEGTDIHYEATVQDICNVTQAHIHLGAACEDGPVVAWLYPETGMEPALMAGSVSGTLTEGTITEDDLIDAWEGATIEDVETAFAEGEVYVNVHTEDHPSGEIRGQIQSTS
ncbi:CHRD domain-containing protein [Saliphagus infecundisoli]|uniref:CHRD domain-containing protein n=1 Tax=Saliphagus infecundisoli TaxID=1849069 RepID=A0ABD5QHU1_9EURY|nr:CHRD domain-containing protein [Saliphagus infecundisoli]